MPIKLRDPAEHDPQWRDRKVKPLGDEFRLVADILHSELRNYLKDAPPTTVLNAAIAVVRALQVAASNKGKKEIQKRHSRPGGSHDKAEAIRKVWASGKYSSRDLCAEEEGRSLGMAPSTARKALRNTPEPSR